MPGIAAATYNPAKDLVSRLMAAPPSAIGFGGRPRQPASLDPFGVFGEGFVPSMLKFIARAAFFWGLTASALAQSGAEITVAPNARQEGLFPFANSCPTAETFKIFAEPEEDWLRFEPASVDVGPNTSFAVRIKVNSNALKPATYRSNVMVVCSSCAANTPPCLQSARQFAVAMKVVPGATATGFVPMAHEGPAAPRPAPQDHTSPTPLIAPAPPPAQPNRMLLPYIALAMLGIGLLGAVVALHGLMVGREQRSSRGQSNAESQRHQIRR